ncbi:MAG: carbohydrate ABC transporter permease [Chloroflexi bacterium]|nr:carbohydrate ABC transporter permease [Chloroflexota bacterium]
MQLSRPIRRFVDNSIVHLIMLLISLGMLIPMLLILSASFSSEAALSEYGYRLIPVEWSLEAYQFILRAPERIIRAYGVTIFVTVFGSAFSLFITSLVAYAIARKTFRFRNVVAFVVFFTMLFNGGLVPWYIMITRYLDLRNTIWVLILPYAVIPWFVLLLRTYFARLPEEILDAARVDGANEWQVFFRIVMPMSTPALATIGLFLMLMYWNDWWLGLLFIDDPDLMPLQLLLYNIQNNISYLRSNTMTRNIVIPAQSVRMALAIVAMGPAVFLALFFQKYFVSGITLGALKD